MSPLDMEFADNQWSDFVECSDDLNTGLGDIGFA
jgi:hypothetical protein